MAETVGFPGYVRLHDPQGRPTGVAAPPVWSIRFGTEPRDPYPGVTGNVTVTVHGGRPLPGALSLDVEPPGEITSELLRWVSLPWLLSTSQLATSVGVTESGGGFKISDPAELESARQLARAGKRVRTEAILPEVARVYLAHPDAPTRAVADHFGKSHPTAGRYVRDARAAGLLPPAEGTSTTRQTEDGRLVRGGAFGDGATLRVRVRHKFGDASMTLDEARKFFNRVNRAGVEANEEHVDG